MRLITFIIALLLLAGTVDPTQGWLIALTVMSGLAAVRWRSWRPFSFRPAIDLRLATFVLAVLLLAGTIDPTKDWLIALSIVSGLAMCTPHLFGALWFADEWTFWPFDGESREDRVARRLERRYRRQWRRWSRWGSDWDWDSGWGEETR